MSEQVTRLDPRRQLPCPECGEPMRCRTGYDADVLLLLANGGAS